jgi:3-methyladenine DNA glycosylase AlkC
MPKPNGDVDGGPTQRAMKDGLDREAIELIARNLERAWDEFDSAGFVRDASARLSQLELKQRVNHVIDVLATHLPDDFPEALDILLRAAEKWDPGDPDDPLRGFAAWPVIDYIATHGLEHFDESLEALRRLTPLFSAEFAIRRFLEHDPARTLARLQEWVNDPDEQVRRLVSEGTRPRLPWGKRLPAFQRDPTPVLDLLEQLRDDASDTVRRSVANNLNDIAKDHPDLVIKVLRMWMRAAPRSRKWIVQHATRTLVKAGHDKVWSLLGIDAKANVRLTRLEVSPRSIELGESVLIRLRLRSRSDRAQKLVVDYAIFHVKADGSTRPKVFKLRKLTLGPGESIDLEKRHPIRRITTRRYYSGRHTVDVRVNGTSLGKKSFELSVPER